MSSFLLERDRIHVGEERATPSRSLSKRRAETRSRSTPGSTRTREHPYIWDEVAELARRFSYEARLGGGFLTVRRRPSP
jgi:hypothetical protein